jgi:16S rRNA (guanine527-N7)-methyltransferase
VSLKKILTSGAPEMGVPLGDIEKFRVYYELLERRNREFNLTAITDENDAAQKHFLDSLGVLKSADFAGKSVIDVGCGAGFPGFPIKIAVPSVKLTSVDSTEKKVTFLQEVNAALSLDAVCLHARAEELGQDENYREKYDIAVSRAVARLNILAELCLPFVRCGGKFLALKALDSDEEIAQARAGIEKLGGIIARVDEYDIPGTELRRRVVVIEKRRKTPEKYPRRFGTIKKQPL